MVDYFADAQIEDLAQGAVRVDFLVTFEFLSETVRVWNGHTSITDTSGNVYQPAYGAMQLELPEYTGEAISDDITVAVDGLPGMDVDILAIALGSTTEVIGRTMRVSLQFFDNDWQPKYDPIAIAWGYMQPPKVSRTQATEFEGSTQRISMQATNVFSGRAQNSAARLTDRDQQARYPGDKFAQFIPGLLNKTVTYPDY